MPQLNQSDFSTSKCRWWGESMLDVVVSHSHLQIVSISYLDRLNHFQRALVAFFHSAHIWEACIQGLRRDRDHEYTARKAVIELCRSLTLSCQLDRLQRRKKQWSFRKCSTPTVIVSMVFVGCLPVTHHLSYKLCWSLVENSSAKSETWNNQKLDDFCTSLTRRAFPKFTRLPVFFSAK